MARNRSEVSPLRRLVRADWRSRWRSLAQVLELFKFPRRTWATCVVVVWSMAANPGYCQDYWLTFRIPEFKVRFIYPPDWEVGTPRGPNVRALIRTKSSEPRHANCNLVVRRTSELSAYSQKQLNDDMLANPFSKQDWLDAFGEKSNGVVVVEVRPAKVDNRPASFGVFEQTYETVTAKIYMRSMSFITVSPGLFWHFTCGAGGASNGEAKSSYQFWSPTLSRIMNSVVFEQ